MKLIYYLNKAVVWSVQWYTMFLETAHLGFLMELGLQHDILE